MDMAAREDKHDNVYHPAHYDLTGLDIQAIDVIRSVLGTKGFEAYCRGNVIKYIIRADRKGETEDLKKARVYLSYEIAECESEEGD